MGKQPLYPHVAKSNPGKKRGSGAFRCSECDYTTWNVVWCPRCGSKNMEELTAEEVQSFYATGQPVIHPRSEEALHPEWPTSRQGEERGQGARLNDVERACRHYNISAEEYYEHPERYPLPERGTGLSRAQVAGILIYDLRGMSLAQISAITNQYPARFYRTHGIDHVHYETTEGNIGECYAKAKQDNAVAMMIQEYGIHWYIRN